MFDIEENLKEFPIIVATGLLGYIWLSQYNPKDASYVPPTKEQVIWEYQNVPLFNRTVDTIVSYLRHRLLTSAMNSDGEERCECADHQGGPCSFCMEAKYNL